MKQRTAIKPSTGNGTSSAKDKLGENPFKHCKYKNPIFFNAESPRRDTYTEAEFTANANDATNSSAKETQPPVHDHHSGYTQRSARDDRVRRNRTAPDARKYLGNGHEKDARRGRERGLSERAGFEPAVQAVPVRRFSKPLVSATHPPLHTTPEQSVLAGHGEASTPIRMERQAAV